jgi:hypothetical protein
MNDRGDSLNRLLKSAAKAPSHAAEAAPFAVETRVMAGWRSAPAHENALLLLLWLRRAIALALAAVLLSIGWAYRASKQSPADEFSAMDSDLQIAVNND